MLFILSQQDIQKAFDDKIASGTQASVHSLSPTNTDAVHNSAADQTGSTAPIVVSIEPTVSGGLMPKVSGITNLPDGTRISVALRRPYEPDAAQRLARGMPACVPNCLPFDDVVAVSDGKFYADFTHGIVNHIYSDIPPGRYGLEIATLPLMSQNADVSRALGQSGYFMNGPLVHENQSGERTAIYSGFVVVANNPPLRQAVAPQASFHADEPADLTTQASAFLAGRQDRLAYDDWFEGLSLGPYREGALFWASNRSMRVPPPCVSAQGDRVWEAGCQAGQERLAKSDIRRKADPNYRAGWNSIR